MAASQRALGTHVFDIDGYGLQKGLGVGNFIRSTEFTVGGYKWCIRYYPDGAGAEESKEYFSVFLELLTKKNAEVRASYRFSLEILVRATWQSSSKFSSVKPFLFSSVSPTSGAPKFKKFTELEASHVDHIRIICDVTVIKETRVAFEVQVPPSNLSDNLRTILETGERADVTFEVKRDVFRAHKLVLRMRSPVFKEKLHKSQKWWQEPQDMKPAVFKALLHFIYTDSLPSMDDLDGDKRKERVTDLLVAADMYKMERMKMMCAAHLCESLHVGTVATTFALAHNHQCSQLKDGCVQFIASSNRMDDVQASQAYKDLETSNPAVALDMFKKVTRAKTPSMAASKRAQGTQVFNIDGYGLQKGLGVGKFIRSTEFTVGGYKWCIRYYPDGAGAEESKEYFSVFLELLTKKNAEVRASYRFSLEILVRATWQSSSKFSSVKPFLFSSVSPTSGAPKFKKFTELEASHVDHIRIICDVTVIKETRVAFEVQVPPSNLSDNLRTILETGERADVTFEVKRDVFRAHKLVLRMRSPVFKEKLQQLQKCVFNWNITIDDVRPDVFDKLLHFIYTDSLPSLDDLDGDKRKEMVTDLLVAADMYKMERMKMMCAAHLCESLHVETVATTFALADKRKCSQLKDACVQFIAFSNRMDDVQASQAYKDLERSHPAVVIDLLKKVCLAK